MNSVKLKANDLQVKAVNEYKSLIMCPSKAVDVQVCLNWIIMPVEHKAKFADWKYNQNVMKDSYTLKKKLLDAIHDINDKPEQYKERFKKVEEIFNKNKENAVFTPDGMKSVSLAAACLLDYICYIKQFY